MAMPRILNGQDEFQQYGVDPNSSTGWDTQNNRYNTSTPGQYLYHGTIEGQTGWYANDSPYGGGAARTDSSQHTGTTPDGQALTSSGNADIPASAVAPPPSILSGSQIAQYGVDPNAAAGWDPTNNRYNTSTPGTYLYHGDVG